MVTKKNDEEQKVVVMPDPCENCPNWQDLKQQRLRLARVMRRAAEKMEDLWGGDKAPQLNVGDYLKLMQYAKEIEKETDEEGPRELTVTWVDRLSK